MGRSSSSSSCFKLITCAGGNDSVDRDDLGVPESKGSSDRSRWSFRKRSARHRVLSNSVASETASGNKASPDSATVNFQTQCSSTIPEKDTVVQWKEEKSPLQIPVDSKLSETIAAADNLNRTDSTIDEASVIMIQAAIRRLLAQRILIKHKHIIKLQAAIRGHIVRRHAIGSLRCVQAIVKMQVLVRERRARLLLQMQSINQKGKENFGIQPSVTYTSIAKLLSNGFARQLLESTASTKTINMKCDPLKPDSAWRWLERWMSVSAKETVESNSLESTTDQPAKENIQETAFQLEIVTSSPENCQSRDEANNEAEPVLSEADENVITYEAVSYNFRECRPTSSSESHSMEQFHPQNILEVNSGISALDSHGGHASEKDVVSNADHRSFDDDFEMKNEQNLPILEMPGLEGYRSDGKKSSLGPRKASNPSFIAAQTKFEELSAANLGKSFGSSNQDSGVDSSLDAGLPIVNNSFRTREIETSKSTFSHTLGVQVVGSECGTDLSISSTLDSPDRSDVGVVEFSQELKSLEDGTDNHEKDFNSEVGENVELEVPGTDLSGSNLILPEAQDHSIVANGDHASNKMAAESSEVEQKQDTTVTGMPLEGETETSLLVSRTSPEASTKSHITVQESQGTPTSQVSVQPKKIQIVKNGPNHKRAATGKESHLEPNQDSGASSSSDHLPKELKSGKRRNSFGSYRTEHGDQEPRDSSSSNSLPGYMQATESARAKALSNSSPRSSPDVQDKDLYMKKRDSLPGASTRQGSPRVHRAQQGVKGNGNHSPQERKWRR